jgi:hypothetical protein
VPRRFSPHQLRHALAVEMLANAGGDYVVFRTDDEGYVDWLTGHPAGYVVNTKRNPKPG